MPQLILTAKNDKRIRIEGALDDKTQLRRVRISPDERWLLYSSHQDGQVAVFKLPSLEQTALIKVGKAPMGFGFPDAADQALVCNHDDGVVSELNLAAGVVSRTFATGNGCEYIQSF
jgi:DNA-binding beta-propeller fold protein YncE